MNEDYNRKISSILAMLCGGALRYAPKPTTELLQGWLLALENTGLSPEALRDAARWWMQNRPQFPAACELIERAHLLLEEQAREERLARARADLAKPALPSPAITEEQKRAILEKMSPGARGLMGMLTAEA